MISQAYSGLVNVTNGLSGNDRYKVISSIINSPYGFSNDGELTQKIAIYGALQLFLDFINIFYYILRILARSRD